VLRVVSERGPVTASVLAGTLEVTDTAIRRHLENLLADGLIEPHDAGDAPRRRGRPARAWVVSPAGHQALASDYGHLAEEALRFLADTAGPDAVTAFAERRVAEIEERFVAALADSGEQPGDRAALLVRILNTAGYAASARPVGVTTEGPALTGIQVCQGHCPVGHVAAEFPQFCDAETEAFSRMLGVHVQRLATLAHGDHVCTTFVPTTGVRTRSGAPGPTTAPTKERSTR
jgi:predicted ArsR family transcriptional regulator